MRKFKRDIIISRDQKPLGPIIILVALAVSVSLLIYGLQNNRDSVSIIEKSKIQESLTESQGESLNDYFEEGFKRQVSSQSDEFLKDDAFADICSSTAGDDKPAVSGNTVCLR